MAKPLQNGNSLIDKSAAMVQPLLSSEDIVRLPMEEFLALLKASPQGLSFERAIDHLEFYGRNEIAREHEHHVIKEFLLHFKSPS